MNLSGLLSAFRSLPPYRALRRDVRDGMPPPPLGLLRAARPPLLAALVDDLRRPTLVIAGTVERAKSLAHSLRDWYPAPERVLRFPEPLALFYERAPWSAETIAARLQVLAALHDPPAGGLIVVASARALMQRTLPPRQFRVSADVLRVGQIITRERTLARWAGMGYEPVTVVESPGQFSHRGGILDIFPPADDRPVRVELFGDQIESLRRFDPATQRSQARVERVVITPAREALPRHGPRVAARVAAGLSADLPADLRAMLESHHRDLQAGLPFSGIEFYLPYFYTTPATLLDYLPAGGLAVVDDWEELEDGWAAFEEEAVRLREATEHLPPDYPLPYLTWEEGRERLTSRPALVLGRRDGSPPSPLGDCFAPEPHFGGQVRPLLAHIHAVRSEGGRVVVVSRQARRLAELWSAEHETLSPRDALPEPPQTPLVFVRGTLEEGWWLRWTGLPALHLLTDAEIFGWRRPEPRRARRRSRAAPETLLADLSPGDFVVHIEYGIGLFRGLVTRALEGVEQEYLLIEYEGSDRLYVPVHQADRVSRYIGAHDAPPRLDRLGTAHWRLVKERAKKAAEDVARDLLDLYAARALADGHAFAPDTAWQAELEAAFPYVETEDQLRAIAEVKADMERPRPMDRLICGDVGYGKTEVALRAAFKAVMDGKQVAILVPTTILAQQHYVTFRQRLAPFPVVVEMLSRFRSRAEQREILERLAAGKVDIIIGTHRLLQKDVVFADLGLLVIDEEQRFGVTHKERLKRMRTAVDVLTLTATPIPRTLYLSLTGVRDISTIETPPEERLPVTTYAGEYDPRLVRRAILRELERGGQTFYVHNRVRTIEMVRRRLEKLVPEATFAVAHGQMREAELEQVMLRFVAGEVDVLVCTSIIESGLDIPNANTLIIERAERFGLAQLYQLRGRVGRGAQRAYAYFFHGRRSRLTPEARQRLETIYEATELGAGYTIAMRDLEIRGAGDILGTRQSGHISAVGFDLYTRLLRQAVEELKARREQRPPPLPPPGDVRIELPVPARLPEDYVADARLRLRIYRRMAELESEEQVAALEQELADRFGPLPPEARDLLFQLRLKTLAQRARIRAVGVGGGRVALRPHGGEFRNWRALQRRLAEEEAIVSKKGIYLPLGADWRKRLVRVLRRLAEEV